MTIHKLASNSVLSKRFHVKGIPKKWIEENMEEASWKLFEAVSDLVLVDNIAIHESKQHSGHFGVLDVVRELDAQHLLSSLDDKDRLHLDADNCYLTIRKFHEPRPKSARRLIYSREEILAMREKADQPPRIHASVYALIKRPRGGKADGATKK